MKTKNIFSLLLLPMALLLSCNDTDLSEQNENREINLSFSVDMSQGRAKTFTEKDTMGMSLCHNGKTEYENIPCVYNPAENKWITTKVLNVNIAYYYTMECRYPYSATNMYPSCYDEKPDIASLDAFYFGRSSNLILIPLHGVSEDLRVTMRHPYSKINFKLVQEDGLDLSLFDVKYVYNDASYGKCAAAVRVSEELFTMYINDNDIDGKFYIYYFKPTIGIYYSYYILTWSNMSIEKPAGGVVCNIEIPDLLFLLNYGYFIRI